jgi:hypothetical protein
MITSESSKILNMMDADLGLGDNQQVVVASSSGMPEYDYNMFLLGGDSGRPLNFSDLPTCVVQQNIFRLFGSKELFKLRQVCTEWNDMIKSIWCQVVKEEMLEQVQNLDLLYEKETTSKLLEFKLKYLVSYA